jgi:hypothetical protein
LHLPYNLFPLRVLKQIATMFMSANGPKFAENQADMVRFILNRDSKDFPPRLKIYAFATLSDRARTLPIMGMINGLGTDRSRVHVFSEIAFPPFGFVLTAGDTPPPRGDFPEISGFSQFEYRDWRVGITMRLPLMSIYTPYPGDYRNREQANRDAAESMRYMAERGR